MKIEISAPVHPTESASKVEKALKNLFPSVEFNLSEGRLTGISEDSKSLNHFKCLLEEQHIRDTANTILRRSLFADSLTFFLNKQTAFVGKVNFSEVCPLDPIKVCIGGEHLTTLIDELAPRTTEQQSHRSL